MRAYRIALTLAYPVVLWLMCVLAAPPAVRAAPSSAPTTRSSPEALLKSKGLVKVGVYYLLAADANLADWLRATRAQEKRVSDAMHHRSALEKEANGAAAAVDSLEALNEAETAKLDRISKKAFATYNVQVDRVNAVRRRLREAKAYLEQCRKALEGVEDPSDQYVSIVLKLSEVMDGLETGYKALAGDADVKRAIDRLNETARPKVKLGPSQAFTQELPEIRKLRETVNAGVVRFEYVGGVPEVPVTLNGGVDVPMVVDSGAAIVTLTSETAKRLGLKPSPGDRVLQLRSADGKLTEAHIMKLKTVRLGKFTVEDVECAVQPPDVKGADNLLGGTFLRHFVYKMDLSAGVLRLTQLTPEGRTAVATTQGAGMVPPPAKPPEVSPVRPPFEIVSARFGGGKKWADVTDRIKELLATGQEIKANTKTLGADPTPGYKKHLEITYMQGGEQKTMRVAEGSEVAASDLKR